MMDAQAQSLLVKLQSFPLDELGASFPFQTRLCHENGWSERFARRAIDEYLRFVVLATLAGHRVSPSPIVDEVWHLHLLYTRSYWDELCGKVLGFPLHHEPSRGSMDRAALAADYKRTLSSYERLLGAAPPPDIWPLPNQHAVRQRKPTSRIHLAVFGAGAIATPVSLSLTDDVLGPLSLSGPDFLILYFFAAPASAFLALATRHALAYSSTREYVIPPLLQPVEIAYLRAGASHAVDVALVDLIGQKRLLLNAHTKLIEPDPNGPLLEEASYRVAAKPSAPTLFEEAILRRVGSGIAVATLRNECAVDAKTLLGKKLIAMGLVWDENRALTIFWLPIVVALVFPGIGLIRIGLGLVHDRPVSILVFLSGLWAVLLFRYFQQSLFTRPRLTSRGTERLNALLSQHDDLFQHPSPADLPLAAALFGKEIAWVGSLMNFGNSLQRLDHPKGKHAAQDGGGAIATCGGAGGDGGGDGGGCGGGCGGCGGGD